MDPIVMADWKLPTDSKYEVFHKLTSSDFHHRVMQCRDPWIILIYKEKIRRCGNLCVIDAINSGAD